MLPIMPPIRQKPLSEEEFYQLGAEARDHLRLCFYLARWQRRLTRRLARLYLLISKKCRDRQMR